MPACLEKACVTKLTAGAVSIERNSKEANEGVLITVRLAVGRKVPRPTRDAALVPSPTDRRTIAERGGPEATTRAQSATPDSALESQKSATRRGASVAGLRRDRRASDTLALVPRNRRGSCPPVATA